MRESGATGYEASKHAAVETRDRKAEINRAELLDTWKSQAQEHNFGPAQIELMRDFPQLVDPDKRPNFDVAEVMDKATVQAATISGAHLDAKTFVDCQGVISAADARKAVSDVAGHANTVSLDGGRYTTVEMLRIEREMLDSARAMQSDKTHAIDPAALDRYTDTRGLSAEQTRALVHITAESGQIAAVQGWAGTGKSYLLDTAREAWEAAGYDVRGAALSGKAAEGLEQSAGIKSETIHSLLSDREPLTRSTVLVVDEAGMVGTRQLSALIDRCEAAGAKLVLVGDSQQLQPIEAGAAFRGVAHVVGSVELSDVRRQQVAADRDAARAIREGRAGDAIKSYQDRGRLDVSATMREAGQQAAAGWVRDTVAGKDSIVLAATRAEVRAINEAARQLARDAGLVRGQDVQVTTSKGARDVAVGDRVVFLRNDPKMGVKNGTLATVTAVDTSRLVVSVREPSGAREISIPGSYTHIDHGYALTVHKSQGVTVDRAHLVAGDQTGREWTYVGATRAREETRIYTSSEHILADERGRSDLVDAIARRGEKDLATDHEAGQEREPREREPREQEPREQEQEQEREPREQEREPEHGREPEGPAWDGPEPEHEADPGPGREPAPAREWWDYDERERQREPEPERDRDGPER